MIVKSKGWVKLHRSLQDWQYYHDVNCVRLLIHLLITVNYEVKKWNGELIPAGTRITSWDHLSRETGLTISQVRTSMRKLERSGEVVRVSSNKWQAVTLVKWGELQGESQADDRQIAGKSQANDKQIATTKESKNNKKDKKVKNILTDMQKEDFKVFWNLYDKKVDRSRCEKKWHALSEQEKDQAFIHIPKYKISQPDKQYRKNPETYLNNKAFQNEIISRNGNTETDKRRSHTASTGFDNKAEDYGNM
jgi:hypothetical protein